MFESRKVQFSSPFKALAIFAAIAALIGCSTPAQQLADAQIAALNKQESKSPEAQTQPYLGGYGPGDPPRLSTDAPYDPLNPELSETVGVPFLSFLIIEPDPVTKNAVPSDIEKLVKARKYQDAIDAINDRLKKTPRREARGQKGQLQCPHAEETVGMFFRSLASPCSCVLRKRREVFFWHANERCWVDVVLCQATRELAWVRGGVGLFQPLRSDVGINLRGDEVRVP